MAYGNIPYTDFTTSDDAGEVLDTKIPANFQQLQENTDRLKDGTACDAKGTYSSVSERLEAIEAALVTPAGSIKYGTNAERLAYGSPAEAMRWHETDTGRDYIWDNTTSSWIEVASTSLTPSDGRVGGKALPTGNIVGDSDTQTLTNKTLTTPTINGSTLSGTHTLTGTIDASGGTVTVAAPSNDTDAAPKSYIDARTVKGFIAGLYPIYYSGSQVQIAPGVVYLDSKWYELSTAVVLTPTLTASSWHYIYVSATPAATTLTASDFIVSTTAPTRSAEGWYDGSGNRCVGFFYADSTPAIVSFMVNSDLWHFDDYDFRLVDVSGDIPSSATSVDTGLDIPATLLLSVNTAQSDEAVVVYIFSNILYEGYGLLEAGASGATQSYLGQQVTVPTDDGTILYRRGTSATMAWFTLRLVGIVIPHGMGRR